jgi:predicted ArsR family transcriptional regulator
MTIDELAEALALTRTAVRAQLATLQHDGTVEQRGVRPGPSKPARLYAVTANAELLFSRAYVPIHAQLLDELAGRMAHEELDGVMREVGRRAVGGRPMPRGSLLERAHAACDLLHELGGLTQITAERRGHVVIRSHGCPLAAATAEHPEACSALESLLSEFVGAPVTKCCDEHDRTSCCFELTER